MKTFLMIAGVVGLGLFGLYVAGFFDADVAVSEKGEAAIEHVQTEGKAQLDRGVNYARDRVHEATAPDSE